MIVTTFCPPLRWLLYGRLFNIYAVQIGILHAQLQHVQQTCRMPGEDCSVASTKLGHPHTSWFLYCKCMRIFQHIIVLHQLSFISLSAGTWWLNCARKSMQKSKLICCSICGALGTRRDSEPKPFPKKTNTHILNMHHMFFLATSFSWMLVLVAYLMTNENFGT